MGAFDRFVHKLRLPSSDVAEANVWINDDIRPMPPSRRRWTMWTFMSFWLTNQVASKWCNATGPLCGLDPWPDSSSTH